jgi:RHS repeat-associated protein
LYGNPYTFTGRELDTLDNNTLHLYYYRARTYDPETGRFMQRDPHGINPAGGSINPFDIHKQYKDGSDIYEYVKSNPIGNSDIYGLATTKTGRCCWWENLLCRWEIISSKPNVYTCWAAASIYGIGDWPFFCWRIDDWAYKGCFYRDKLCKEKYTYKTWHYLGMYIIRIGSGCGAIINFEPDEWPLGWGRRPDLPT